MITSPPWLWVEEDVLTLERQQIPERLDLEYKSEGSLESTDSKKTEISKDMSAMANSAGGIIIYGVDEDRTTGHITVVGVDPSVSTAEWLEQVITARVQRRIDGLRIHVVRLETARPGRVAYVVSVPQSTRAPHMAYDHRFYKRQGTTTVMMEEYEVRDVSRRSEAPDLSLSLSFCSPFPPEGQVGDSYSTSVVALCADITNISPEPAFYATVRIFVDVRLTVQSKAPVLSRHPKRTWNAGDQRLEVSVLHRLWAIPENNPLLETETHKVGFWVVQRHTDEKADFRLGWEVRAPKMALRSGSAILRWGMGVPELIASDVGERTTG